VTLWGACAGAGSCQDLWTRGAHARAGLLAGLVTPWGPTVEQPVPEGLHPVGRTHAGAVHEELQPVGRTHVEVRGELSAVGASEESRKEGAAETMCDDLTTTPVLCPPAPLGYRR